MGKIQWEKQADGSFLGTADLFFDYEVPCSCDFEREKPLHQAVHDERISRIAAANGFVKPDSSRVVISVEDAVEALREMTVYQKRYQATYDEASTHGRITAALNAAKGE